MGYHIRAIEKGTLGQTSKIREELEELEDALFQNSKIMALIELSDLFGAVRAVAENLGVTMEDLEVMANITKRAFEDGTRKSE